MTRFSRLNYNLEALKFRDRSIFFSSKNCLLSDLVHLFSHDGFSLCFGHFGRFFPLQHEDHRVLFRQVVLALKSLQLSCKLDHCHAPYAGPYPPDHNRCSDDLQEGSTNIDEKSFALASRCMWKTEGEEGSKKGTETRHNAENRQDDGNGKRKNRQRFSKHSRLLLHLEDFPSQFGGLSRRIDASGLRFGHGRVRGGAVRTREKGVVDKRKNFFFLFYFFFSCI